MHASLFIAALFAAATAHAAVIDVRAATDFGSCTPTMDFQLGRPGRKANEGTFLPTDPLVAKGQQDALNPNIITNRVGAALRPGARDCADEPQPQLARRCLTPLSLSLCVFVSLYFSFTNTRVELLDLRPAHERLQCQCRREGPMHAGPGCRPVAWH